MYAASRSKSNSETFSTSMHPSGTARQGGYRRHFGRSLPSGFPTQILYTRWTLFSNLFFFLAFDFRWFPFFLLPLLMRSLCRSLKVLRKLSLLSSSGCYICRMSCQQLYNEQKIQIILYTAIYMHVRFNYDNVSFKRGVTPQKMTVCGGGAGEKLRTWGAMVIRNGGSKNSTSPPPYLVKNERSLINPCGKNWD